MLRATGEVSIEQVSAAVDALPRSVKTTLPAGRGNMESGDQ